MALLLGNQERYFLGSQFIVTILRFGRLVEESQSPTIMQIGGGRR